MTTMKKKTYRNALDAVILRGAALALVAHLGLFFGCTAEVPGGLVEDEDIGAVEGAQVAAASGAGGDPCAETTLVTNSGPRMTAGQLCDALQGHVASGGDFALYATQCYGGGVIDCCIQKGIKGGFYGSGSQADETQNYGEYDNGVAGALAPGADTGDVHNSGAGNTTGSTPQSSGTPSAIPGDAHAMTFAGQPTSNGSGSTHEAGHNSSIEGSFGADNTTTLTGDGTGADAAATAQNLLDAIADHAGGFLVIYLDDHGNKGKLAAAREIRYDAPGVFRIDLGELLYKQAMTQEDSNPGLFIMSQEPLPHVFRVQIDEGPPLKVAGYDAEVIEYRTGVVEYRKVIPFAHNDLLQASTVVISDAYHGNGEPVDAFTASAMIDVEVAKNQPAEPPREDDGDREGWR